MLRNGLKTAANHGQLQQRKLSISIVCSNKSNLNKQGKIMSKLFGQRLTGSKKRWYPTMDTNMQSQTGGSLLFKATQLSKPGGAGKNTSRRVAVLNKLFMEEISSLLATGGTAENFLGRGLQLTRVKIAADFTSLNVYWLGSGDPLADGKLSEELQRCSGLIRHELSQLRVMGEVPRISFIQDKTFANIEHVENILKNLKFEEETDEMLEENYEASRIKTEFYGNNKIEEINDDTKLNVSLPPMRHDVFGLDHRNITAKILLKMRKTKQAWDTHSERETSGEQTKDELSMLKSVQQKIIENNEASSEEFNKFLAQRRDRKNTPERKKYRRSDEVIFMHNDEDLESDVITSKELERYMHQEDYLPDEYIDEKK